MKIHLLNPGFFEKSEISEKSGLNYAFIGKSALSMGVQDPHRETERIVKIFRHLLVGKVLL
jgi:hypothetical protein